MFLSKLAKPLDAAWDALLSLSMPSSPGRGLCTAPCRGGCLGRDLRVGGRSSAAAGWFLSPCLAFSLGGRSEVLWINPEAP